MHKGQEQKHPQGFILWPLRFNIFLNGIFYFESRSFLSNYAHENVFYAFGFNLEEVKKTKWRAPKTIRMVLWNLHDLKPGNVSLHVQGSN